MRMRMRMRGPAAAAGEEGEALGGGPSLRSMMRW